MGEISSESEVFAGAKLREHLRIQNLSSFLSNFLYYPFGCLYLRNLQLYNLTMFNGTPSHLSGQTEWQNQTKKLSH